jgi:hypothetical protein
MSKLLFALSLLAALIVAGCGGSGGDGGSGGGGGLPKTIKLIANDDRGYLLDNGRVALLVLQGTVTADTVVNVSAPTGLPSDPNFIPGSGIQFSNATLLKPVNLRIQYKASDLPSGADQSKLRLVQLEGSSWVLVANSTVDVAVKTVRGDISNFGTFGISLIP